MPLFELRFCNKGTSSFAAKIKDLGLMDSSAALKTRKLVSSIGDFDGASEFAGDEVRPEFETIVSRNGEFGSRVWPLNCE